MVGRDLGAVEFLRAVLPDGAVAAFAALTHLGDTALFFVALALCYWYGDRRRGAYLLGTALGGLALIVALKGLFALPRPPLELQAATVEGYGFPSGHALGATVVWGLLALTLDVGTRRQRTAVAALLVVVVSLSRVVIGVHYLGDVFAGVVVGLVYLGVATRAIRGDPDRAFALAGVVAVVAVATSVASADAVMAVGGVLGGWTAWRWASPSAEAVRVPAAATTLAALGAVAYLVETLVVPVAALFVVAVAVPAGIVLLPAVEGRVRHESPCDGTTTEPSGSSDRRR